MPWAHDRCILCRCPGVLTEEHVIPRSLGGRLTVDLLCASCNSDLGHRLDAFAKKDPAITLAIHRFAATHPNQAQALLEGMDLIAHSDGGDPRAQLRNGDVRVRSHQLSDGSLIQPTDAARDSVRRMLEKRGTPPVPLEEALQRFDSAPPDERVEVEPGLEVVKWTVSRVQPDLSGPPLNPLLPLKIAFEFLACHLGGPIYESASPLEVIRNSLRKGCLDESIEVESLRAEREQPLHGIVFEGNDPYARVQLRLFGTLAYRVHLKTLAVGGTRFVYTHMLSSNEESVAEAKLAAE